MKMWLNVIKRLLAFDFNDFETNKPQAIVKTSSRKTHMAGRAN